LPFNDPGQENPRLKPLVVFHLNSLLTGGGTDDQCVQLCAQLQKLGVRVGLVGPEGREFARVARTLGVPLHATPPEGLAKLCFILAAARTIRRERPQLVHGHHGRDIWPTILAARLSGIRPRVVLTRHLAKSPASLVSRRFLLGQVDSLVAVSRFVARVLREGHYEPQSPVEERRSRPPLHGDHRKIHVIHGGIDATRFQPLPPEASAVTALRTAWGVAPGQLAFGVVGGYDLPRGKGQREFLQAAARVARQAPQACFVIVGRGNMAALLAEDIRALGLEGIASLTPYCRDMPAAMNALDCLVHPQIGTEAFPGVILEALACGRRVIASDLDGIPEAFAACPEGRLVKPESVEELASALLAEARQPPLTMAHREAMHQRIARQFDLPVVAGRVLDHYREVLAGG
jgi:glycosyltransferase involved in cell wall biosynthesis